MMEKLSSAFNQFKSQFTGSVINESNKQQYKYNISDTDKSMLHIHENPEEDGYIIIEDKRQYASSDKTPYCATHQTGNQISGDPPDICQQRNTLGFPQFADCTPVHSSYPSVDPSSPHDNIVRHSAIDGIPFVLNKQLNDLNNLHTMLKNINFDHFQHFEWSKHSYDFEFEKSALRELQ